MQNFKNIEDLVIYMLKKLDGDDPVSIVAYKDLAVSVMKRLLDYDNVVLDICDIDSFEYDREYIVSLHDETDTNYWHVSVEQIYSYKKEKYFATDGYVLFHEDTNSRALVDMQSNKYTELSGYDWFIIGEPENELEGEPCKCNVENKLSEGCVEYYKDKDDAMHGFTAHRSDGNVFQSYSLYTTNKLSRTDIQEFLQEAGF